MRLFATGVQRISMPLRMLGICVLFLLGTYTMNGQLLSTYTFSASTGTQNDMGAASTAYGAGIDDGVTGVFNIGFTFTFNSTAYTQFWVSSNGYIGLGPSSPGSYLSGSFTSASFSQRVIVGLWRDLHTGNDGYVKYLTSGVAGSRVLTVEWRVRDYPGSGQPTNTTFQIRLYEGSNRFDMWYGPVTTAGGTIGGWISNSNFASVAPATNTVSYVTSTNNAVPPSNVNRVYAFDLCTVTATGNIAQGGTATMQNFDTLMQNVSVMRGNSSSFTPMTITPTGCTPTANMTYSITGVHASDYSISPPNASIAPGNTSVPVITFSPSLTGRRNAVLTVSGPSNFLRTYYLSAKGDPRLVYTGNIAQGGTAGMANGDSLFKNVAIMRRTSIDLQPFMLTNTSANVEAPPANVTYQIRGTSGGQYVINPTSGSLSSGQSQTPTITFTATGIGTVLDTLIVNADGEIRMFPLVAFSEAPGIEIRLEGVVLDSNSALYRNQFSCMGGTYVTYELKVKNVGAGILNIWGYDVFETDTAYTQGQPRYPLIREGGYEQEGGFKRSNDYILTEQPPVLPTTDDDNSMNLPVQIGRGETKTLYLSFNAQRRDKRFARLFLRSNGENVFNVDQWGEMSMGLIWFDLFGRGIGGRLSDNGTAFPIKAVVFPNTRIDSSSTQTFTFYNSGECDLRISMDDFRFTSGDVEEFSIDSLPTGTIDATTNDLIIPAGQTDRVVVRFTPKQQGSRRASLRVQTNDSMKVVENIVERGLYYVDFFGAGKTGLYMQGYNFGQVLLGADASEQRHGVVRLENSRLTPIEITNLEIDGADKTEFVQDASKPWPTLPDTLAPGEILELAVVFAPAATGTAGGRNGAVRATTGDGDIIMGSLVGEAGTRTIEVNPGSVNFGSLRSGRKARQMIVITNTGTMPLTVMDPVAPAGSDFEVSVMPRHELAPGQFELLEVTYAPTSPGAADATLEIMSNGTNGTQSVQLKGLAVAGTKFDIADGASIIPGVSGGADVVGSGLTEEFSVSGVNGIRTADGMVLMQSIPNPARDIVEIGYVLPARGEIVLALYDANGRLVRTLDAGMRESGERRLRIDVSDLTNGVYHYRITAGATMLSRTLTVVK